MLTCKKFANERLGEAARQSGNLAPDISQRTKSPDVGRTSFIQYLRVVEMQSASGNVKSIPVKQAVVRIVQ
jgi:hypothetical protein